MQSRWWTVFCVGLCCMVMNIGYSNITTAIPIIQAEFHVGTSTLQWLLTGILITSSSLMITAGRLGDIYGRKRLLLIAMSILVAVSLVAGFVNSIGGLIACRVIQGISVAIIFPCSGSLIAHTFSVEERGKAIGVFSAMIGLGLALGPVVGGFLVDALGWRWVFYFNGIAAFLVLLLSESKVVDAEHRDTAASLDWLGALCLAVGLASLIYGITYGLQYLIITIAAFVAFIFIERYVEHPIIDLRVLFKRNYALTAAVAMAFGFCFFTIYFFAPLYLQNILDFSASDSGLIILPVTATLIITSPLTGRFVDKYGVKAPLLLGLVFCFIATLSQTFFGAGTALFALLLVFFVMGLGWGFLDGPIAASAIIHTSEKNSGTAAGTIWTFQNTGGAIGLAICTSLFSFSAKSSLVGELAKFGATNKISQSVGKMLSAPKQAILLLDQSFHSLNMNATKLFHQSFLSGFHLAMTFLAVSCAVAFLLVLLFFRGGKQSAA